MCCFHSLTTHSSHPNVLRNEFYQFTHGSMINQFGIVYKISEGNFTLSTLHSPGKNSVEKINKHGNTIGKIFYRMNLHQLLVFISHTVVRFSNGGGCLTLKVSGNFLFKKLWYLKKTFIKLTQWACFKQTCISIYIIQGRA